MAKRYLRNIVQPFTSATPSSTIVPINLPVNPLAKLILTIRGTEVAQTAADVYRRIAFFRTFVTNLFIAHKGENVIQGSLTDLAMLNAVYQHDYPASFAEVTTTGVVRAAAFPLNFSPIPFWHDWGFPATSRGNLLLNLTFGALPAGFSAMSFQVESVEMIEDDPSQHLKYITNTRTPTATGQDDRSLPIGNPLLGILLFDPNQLGATLGQRLWGQVKLLKDNVEQYIALSDWESLRQAMYQREFFDLAVFDKRVQENLAAAYTQFANSAGVIDGADDSASQYAYIDLDPTSPPDQSYQLDTAGAADLKLRAFIDTGATLNTVRWLPIERVANR
jgi:hypothetical protein